jgi:hypothetical protein
MPLPPDSVGVARALTSGTFTHLPPELGKWVPPDPLATYFQPLRLAPSTFAVRHKVYVWAPDNPQAGTFEPIYHRLADADDWQTDKLPTLTTSSRRHPPSSWP